MSALEWGPTDLGYAGLPAPRRPHLVVLAGAAGGAAQDAKVRLTCRGCLALLTVALAIVAAVGLVGMGGAGAAEPLPTMTVRPGQTLSEIALAELPQMNLSQAIVAIQVANQLSTAQISAGQQLVIPRS